MRSFLRWLLEPFVKIFANPNSLKESSPETYKISGEFSIIGSTEETELAITLIKFFFSPALKSCNAIQSESYATFKNFKDSSGYVYLENFVKKYNGNYCEDDLLKFKQLLSIKGFNFNQDEVRDLIIQEKKEQDYFNFKKTLLEATPKTLKDFVAIFAKNHFKDITLLKKCRASIKNKGIFGTALSNSVMETESGIVGLEYAYSQALSLSVKVFFLKRLFKESGIDLKQETGESVSNEMLIEIIMKAIEECELGEFENSLVSKEKKNTADTLNEIVTSLRRILNEGGKNNFVIFESDKNKNYYIQFAGAPTYPSSLHAEAVGNGVLLPEFKLNENKIILLKSLGWNLPDGSNSNFYREYKVINDNSLIGIANDVIRTFVDVYNCSLVDNLNIKLNLE